MKILGIETSCDETAAAIVEDGKKIISNVVASSLPLHAETGGVIPETAAREQVRSIIPVIAEATKDTEIDSISAVAVSYGPGLIGSLLVGVETAKSLSLAWQKPLIPINHLVGHFYSAFLQGSTEPAFPILALIVSGGHTELVLAADHGKFHYLGGTRDDAAGEAFDKVARLLDLGYPGGPAIQKAAEKGDRQAIDFPRPLLDSKDYDFSFSGLKTAAKREVEKTKVSTQDFAASFQEAIVDVLMSKSKKAFKEFKATSFLLGGGVAANAQLRNRAKKIFGEKLFVSDPKLSIDNAAMIASAAYFNFKPLPCLSVKADPALLI